MFYTALGVFLILMLHIHAMCDGTDQSFWFIWGLTCGPVLDLAQNNEIDLCTCMFKQPEETNNLTTGHIINMTTFDEVRFVAFPATEYDEVLSG
jgi:hypothetical protein